MYTVEEFDFAKSKLLKYIMYKKRTKKEVLLKFSKDFSEEILDDLIDELEENGYINDNNYIKRAVNEFEALSNLSIKEIKYKLLKKGINSSLIEDYISDNYDELIEYELNSAKKIVRKKKELDKEEIKKYLIKKGYREESIKDAIEEY